MIQKNEVHAHVKYNIWPRKWWDSIFFLGGGGAPSPPRAPGAWRHCLQAGNVCLSNIRSDLDAWVKFTNICCQQHWNVYTQNYVHYTTFALLYTPSNSLTAKFHGPPTSPEMCAHNTWWIGLDLSGGWGFTPPIQETADPRLKIKKLVRWVTCEPPQGHITTRTK